MSRITSTPVCIQEPVACEDVADANALPALVPAAPPSYAEIVTEEQRQSTLEVPAAREELDGPLFAYIHEFRFQPPPLYSEVGNE